MSIFLICLNYLSYLSNLLETAYYLNNKFLFLQPSPIPELLFLTLPVRLMIVRKFGQLLIPGIVHQNKFPNAEIQVCAALRAIEPYIRLTCSLMAE